MSWQSVQQALSGTSSFTPVPSGLLQRKCAACGTHTPGGGSCGACAEENKGLKLQKKLSIGASNDPLEAEADRVAEQVLAMGTTPGIGAARPRIQRFAPLSAPEAETAPESVHRTLVSSGAALDSGLRQDMETRFGHDFTGVRVHSDAVAAQSAHDVDAHAYTVGNNIAFGAGQFAPGSAVGRRLLAHELTHVVQQRDEGELVQRAPTPAPAPGVTPPTPPPPARAATDHGSQNPVHSNEVISLTMCCNDMLMRVETASTKYLYEMDECSIPLGDYTTDVTMDANNFHLDFGDGVGADQEFKFSYIVKPDDVNPARLLKGQATVPVHVVESLSRRGPVETDQEQEHDVKPECVMRIDDRTLIPSANFSRELFSPIVVPETTLWTHPIPLGWYGWVEVNATAQAKVQGQLDASYGPGQLSNICLTYLHDRTTSTAPIEHPLLGSGSHADSSVYGIGGRAHFNLPARINVALGASGTLKVAGDYLSVIELAAAEGSLSANGVATLSGSIDADVAVLARMQRNSATLEGKLLPLSVTITDSSFDGIDLMAAVNLRGNAALSFRLDGGARFRAFGTELWSERWNLADFNTGIGWTGGLTYSPNPGLHWDLGEVGALTDDPDGPSLSAVDDMTGVPMHEDDAAINGSGLLADLFEEAEAPATTPDGLSPSSALPFEWRKPLGLYPATLDIPRADSPKTLNRDDGPTTVQYLVGGRLNSEQMGVSDWPSVGRTFQYMPYAARVTPEQSRFNRVLDRLGFSRSGLDAEHVWDVALRGLGYDQFSNLWPASNQDQQLAGSQHEQQMAAYRSTIGNIGGRYFRIVNVRHPAR